MWVIMGEETRKPVLYEDLQIVHGVKTSALFFVGRVVVMIWYYGFLARSYCRMAEAGQHPEEQSCDEKRMPWTLKKAIAQYHAGISTLSTGALPRQMGD